MKHYFHKEEVFIFLIILIIIILIKFFRIISKKFNPLISKIDQLSYHYSITSELRTKIEAAQRNFALCVISIGCPLIIFIVLSIYSIHYAIILKTYYIGMFIPAIPAGIKLHSLYKEIKNKLIVIEVMES